MNYFYNDKYIPLIHKIYESFFKGNMPATISRKEKICVNVKKVGDTLERVSRNALRFLTPKALNLKVLLLPICTQVMKRLFNVLFVHG